MPRQLAFQFGPSVFAFEMQKVDRDKLYGFKENEVLDDQGRVCELATLADDGCTIIGKGGTGFGYRSATGLWCEKKSLKPLDLEGREIHPVPSSFDAPIALSEAVDIETYLNHNLRSVYVLNAAEDAGPLLEELQKGTIFSFPFSYRGGLEADTGFLLTGQDGNIFFAVGSEAKLEFVGLGQTQGLLDEDDQATEDGEDLMDFGMI
jgi:hypothetical protein